MGASHITHTVLRRIRDRLRAGEAAADIAASMGISAATVYGQAMLLRLSEGPYENAIRSARRQGAKRRLVQLHPDQAEENGDLVEVMASPKTPGQLRYWQSED